MVDGERRARDVRPQVLLGVGRRDVGSLDGVGLHGGLVGELDRELHRVDHQPHVLLGRVEVVADDRMRGRVVRPEPHAAAALLLKDTGRDQHAVVRWVGHALVDDLDRDHVELDVGRGGAALEPHERARLGDVRGERPGLALLELLQRGGLEGQQQAHRLGRAPHPVGRRVVGEVLAHRGLVEQDVDLAQHQVLGRADAGEHQQLRRVVGAGAQDHLALGAELLDLPELGRDDADGAGALEQDAVRVHVRHHREVRPPHGRVQIGDRRAGAHPAAHRHLVGPEAVLFGAVEVFGAGEPELDAGLDERRAHDVLRAAVGDGQRPAGAVKLVLAALVVLGLLEVRQQVVEGPARDAPAVVVRAVAADVDHVVDR